MTLQDIQQKIAIIAGETLGKDKLVQFEVSYTDAQFGDFATNIALVHAKELKQNPRELAEKLAADLGEKLEGAQAVTVAGPGFINIRLTDATLGAIVAQALKLKPDLYAGQEVVAEYSDPNPFKVLHVGHLYTSIVGDAIANLVRNAGGKVHPVNFGGDVGLHVGRTLWAIVQELGGEKPEGLTDIAKERRSEWMAECYVRGTQAYEEDEAAKQEIIALNKKVYQIHTEGDRDSALAQVYWTCRQWSYDYFEEFYARLGTKFEKYYPESVTAPLGLEVVRAHIKDGVYNESEGAIVFEGEPYGLHTRVFITSAGLPTYEAKDVGLIMSKWNDYHFDRSLVITGNDILDYMKVVLKSLEQFAPELAARSRHITHGNVKLAGGIKMSSRKGNFLRAIEVLEIAAEANKKASGKDDERVVLGAVKYALLKQRIGQDIIYVPEESVSLEGNSGPYLQYAHARARSILQKTEQHRGVRALRHFEPGERVLARKLIEYEAVVEKATSEHMPHHICTFLYELSQTFNRFYEQHRVIGDSRQAERLVLVQVYAGVLKEGLSLLGIEAPDRL